MAGGRNGKDPARLNQFKKQMKKNSLSEVSIDAPADVYGGSLLIQDSIFIENATKLHNNLATFQQFQIPFVLLIAFLIILLTFLIMRSRRMEIAIASSLGCSGSSIALHLFLEVLSLNIAGSLLGILLLRFVTMVSMTDLLLILGGFAVLASIGICIALGLLFRFDIMIMLTQVE